MSITWLDGSDGVTITAEIALSAPGGVYGLWGLDQWGGFAWGPDVAYVDLSSRLRSFTTSRKFSRGLHEWQSGTAEMVLDNRDGDLSPHNLAGTYVVAGVTMVRPGIRARLSVTIGTTVTRLITGIVDDLAEEILSSGPDSGDAVMRVRIVDDWAELAIDGEAIAVAGAGDTFAERGQRILTAADWGGSAAFDVGVSTFQGTTLSSSPARELAELAVAEGGAVWPDADGVIRGAQRYALIEDDRSNTVQAVFGDDASATWVPYSDPKPSYCRDLICNRAVYTRTGGTAQSVTNEQSRATYRLRRETRTGMPNETDAQVLALAQWQVAQYADPQSRIEQITVYTNRRHANYPSGLWAAVIPLRERDLVRVIYRPPGGFTVTLDNHIAGISHMAGHGRWVTTIDLWSAKPYTEFATSRWGYGEWGSFRWFV